MTLPPQLITPRQAAAILGVSTSTLASWRDEGRGPRYVKLSNNTVRYDRADLEAYVQVRRVTPEQVPR